MDLANLLARIESSLIEVTRPSRTCVTSGPFLLMLDLSSEIYYLNYAVPVEDREFTRADVDAMVTAFREAGKMPRLEFTRERWPQLEKRLLESGFDIEAEQPTMVLQSGELVTPKPVGAELSILKADDDLAPFMTAIGRSFEFEEPITEARIDKARRNITSGTWRCGQAKVDGQVAAGATTTPMNGVAELAGVATVPEFRRRGLASAVSAFLLEDHFQTGDLAWLSAGDDVSRQVYERLGFRTVATHLNMRLPS